MSYTRVNWQNKPSTATPINATNLNTMDAGIAANDAAIGTLDTAVQGKVDKVEGKGLSTNDFTDADALKLAGIEDGAEVNVQADWDEADNTADDYIKNKPDLSVYAEKDSLWQDATATGNPVTIKAQSAQAAKSTKLSMLPVQDLHGYSKPWVGGSGKNKLPSMTTETKNGVTLTNDNGVITLTGTASSATTFTMSFSLAANSYNVCAINPVASPYIRMQILDANEESVANGYLNSVNRSLNFSVVADATFTFNIIISSGTNTGGFKLSPQIVVGSSADTTFEPYSNICPISGRTQAEIVTQGVNLWDEVTELGIINQTTGQNQNADNQIRSKNYTAIQPNTKYCFLCKGARISQIFWYDKNNAYLSYTQNTTDSAFITTSPANAYYVRFQFPMAYGTTYQNDGGVNYPSSYTDYSAHTEQTVTISFGQTVYGGTLDVETGVLTVDTLMFDLGDLTWQTTQQTPIIFYADPRNLDEYIGTAQRTIVCCSAYQAQLNVSGAAGARTFPNGSICGFTNPDVGYHRIFVKDEAYSDAETFTTAVTGVKACYKLATPTTTTLTAAQVNLIKGINNISTDADGISITYFADGESLADADNRITAVLGDFATVEGARASQNYAIGDYLIFADKFCKASAAIATGEALAIGTNLTQTTIGAELKAILAQL